MSNDYIAPIVAKLTYNGAANLRGTIEHPATLGDPDYINGNQRIFTGTGKWTHIASMGVERHLCALGLAEMRWDGTYWYDGHAVREEHQKNKTCCITPLGREVAAYLIQNWADLTFLEKGRRR